MYIQNGLVKVSRPATKKRLAEKVKRSVSNALLILSIALLIWVITSWAEIAFKNTSSMSSDRIGKWNAFVIMIEFAEARDMIDK